MCKKRGITHPFMFGAYFDQRRLRDGNVCFFHRSRYANAVVFHSTKKVGVFSSDVMSLGVVAFFFQRGKGICVSQRD